MKKLMIVVLVILLVPTISCKNIFGPSDPPNITNYYEIMYVRALTIINPNQPDPTNHLFSIFGPNGGFNSMAMVQVESDKWVAEVMLNDGGPYFISLYDKKVVNVIYGEILASVAEDIYMRLKGTDPWIKLTSVGPYIGEAGNWAKFFVSKGIKNP